MGIQINGATDSITAIDGTIDVVSAIGNAGVVTATAFVGNITGNVTGNINHASNLELQTGGVTRASIKSDGKLGLGVATPLATMHIEGGSSGNLIQLTNDQTGDTSSDGFVIGVNAAEAYFYHRETKHIKFGTANGERLRITSDGKLGLGVATPQAAMHIEGGSNGNLLQLSNTNTGATAGDGFVIGINSLLTYVYNRENKDLTFGTNNSERLRITSTGDVAINRTSPLNTAKFSLTKDADQQAIGVQLNQSSGITTSLAAYNSSGTNIFDLAHDTDNTPDLLFKLKHSSDAAPVEKVRITSDGKVGINDNNPANQLVVKAPGGSGHTVASVMSGDATTRVTMQAVQGTEGRMGMATNHPLAIYAGALERLRITAGGNVEIGSGSGTGSDFSLLDGMVINAGNGKAGLIINSYSSGHNAYMSFGYGSGSGTSHADQYSAYIGRVGDNTLIFGTNNSIRAKIDPNGNFNLGLSASPAGSSTEQGVYLAGADSTQSVISSNVTPFVVNRVGTGGNDRNCIEFRNNGSLKGTVGAVGVNNGIFFQSGVTEVMRITNDYKILVGLTTTGTSTSNNNLELAGTKMLKVGNFYIGYVIGTGNNGSGTLVLHKMGQNVGLQFSGMVTCHSYTGSAYLSGCIVVRYNTDAVTRDVTLQKAQSGMNFQIVSGTISGESGTYFGIKKNAGGTGSFYINAFVGGNIESYGGIREVSSSDWTTTTVHGSGIT